MSSDILLKNLLPPANPVEIPNTADFIAVEKQVGTLPDDYKVFVSRFGTGVINRFLWILNPASVNQHLNFLRGGEPILSALRELKATGEYSPYPLYPEVGGLLPFGKTDNGDALFWLRIGEPNQWPVIVNAARDANYEKFDCGMAGFLSGILTRRIRCTVFPNSFPSDAPVFVSVPPKS